MKSYSIIDSIPTKFNIGCDLEEYAKIAVYSFANLFLFPEYKYYHNRWEMKILEAIGKIPKPLFNFKFPNHEWFFKHLYTEIEYILPNTFDSCIFYNCYLTYNESRYQQFDIFKDFLVIAFYQFSLELSNNGKIDYFNLGKMCNMFVNFKLITGVL